MSISVRYIYSACVVIETEDIKILCDPWFTQGVYDGSWFQFPLIKNPLDIIGDVDIIFISHIHPDHYDPKFLNQYFNRYGKKELIIYSLENNHLQKKMMVDGFEPLIVKEYEGRVYGKTKLNIIAHDTGSVGDIDSALSVEYKSKIDTHVVLNINDIITDDQFLAKINNYFPEINILLLGYTGAGPYPQTYFDLDDDRIIQEATKKKIQFYDRYIKNISSLNSKVNIPFAGKYLLGGALTKLNQYRGVADPVEILEIDNKSIVLDDGGSSVINTKDMIPSSTRVKKYSKNELQIRLDEIKNAKMDYETLMDESSLDKLPLLRLLPKAYKNALKYSQVIEDYYFFIRLGSKGVLLNANKNNHSYKILNTNDSLPTPRSEIIINKIYLFGLLTMIYHWNNAEVGSQYFSRRYPNEFNRAAQSFLSFFHV